MSERKAFLEKIHIKDFLSLHDVTLLFKPLTVLVGPNASGKSNVLKALSLLKMMVNERLPSEKLILDSLWAGGAKIFAYELHTKVAESPTLYNLEIEAKPEFPFQLEQLLVDDVKVISIQGEKRVVRDENNKSETTYNSDRLALGSAGNYGDKPITRALTEFIKGWQFYNFDTDFIRASLTEFLPSEIEIGESPKLDRFGRKLPEVLWDWHNNSLESFQNVSDALATSTSFEIDQCLIDGKYQLCILEGYRKPIPLYNASDGTLRLVAYNILLNESDPSLFIAIEEPEQNLHPSAISGLANVLEQIAQYSQVIITTHSSQLLGAFNPENLSDSLGVLLLDNRPGIGTTVLNLEDYQGNNEALEGWIADFGIGSAIFDSGLLPDKMEDTTECQT